MAIEGPLRELGIHDVFQLLDLSRKTGRLRVTSALRDNEGTVFFRNGRVISATIRSNPWPLGQLLLRAGRITEEELERARSLQRLTGERRRIGELLVQLGALSARELERQVRLQVETVVFELMSWQEGYFSFSEGDAAEIGAEAVGLSAESLLMEGARRIDEWARIAHCIPHVGVVPGLAPVDATHPARLDLLPNEWEVLAAVDGVTDLRGVAETLGRAEFDVARIVYGLVTTGVLDVRQSVTLEDTEPISEDPVLLLTDARDAADAGRLADALALAQRAARAAPDNPAAWVEQARALVAMERLAEADAAVQRALSIDAHGTPALMLAARACVGRGDLEGAAGYWQRVVLSAPLSADAETARQGIAHASRLSALVGAIDE